MGSGLDVVGIGNAIVDVVAEADDALLAEEGLPKGSMTLIDAERAEALRARMGPAVEVSGGSAANTMVGVARLGGAAAMSARCGTMRRVRCFATTSRKRASPSPPRRRRTARQPRVA